MSKRPASASPTTPAKPATSVTSRTGASRGEFEAFRFIPFRTITQGDRPIFDTVAALVCHGVFHRFPGVRVAAIENGSVWAPQLFKKFEKTYAHVPKAFPGNPIE
ncbi:MAG: hypothetical protein U0V73_05390 [Acidimicrobiia bacterium]